MVHLYEECSPYRHNVPIKTAFFDNDDVLYKAPSDQADYHKLAAIRAVQQTFHEMPTRQLERLLELGKSQGKGSLDIFVELFDLDSDKLRMEHYKELIKLTRAYPQFFKESEFSYGDLAKLRIAGVNTHIITHGNPEWTEYTMSKGQRQISDFFSQQAQSYTCKDEMPNHSGKTKIDIYELALDKMDVPKALNNRGLGSAMSDDTMENLRAAKELGMMTIFVKRDEKMPFSKVADYVDVVVTNCNQAIHSIMQSNAFHEAQLNLDIDIPYL